jgi:protein involved in polysaccharide export with SLBB domain
LFDFMVSCLSILHRLVLGIRTRRLGRVSGLSSAFVGALVAVTASPSLATIHSGDTLFVKVWNHPELSKQVVVDSAGRVRLPFSQAVPIAGLEESAAARRLTEALRRLIVYPTVSVETIEQGRSIFVSSGPVGVITYQPGETLSAAISDIMQQPAISTTSQLNDAGQTLTKSDGVAAAARARIDLHAVRIQRDGATLGKYDAVEFGAKGDPGPRLVPGDTIVFSYKPIAVRVIGDVAQPGTTYLSEQQTISEAISQAGGALPTSVSNRILLERDGQTRSLALGDPIFMQPAHAGDVLTIPPAPRINVAGMVAAPGIVSLKIDPSLLSALYTAGGPTKWANLTNIQIVRKGQRTAYDVTRLTHGDISQNPELQDGDTVVVPEGHKIDYSNFFGVLDAFVTRVPI